MVQDHENFLYFWDRIGDTFRYNNCFFSHFFIKKHGRAEQNNTVLFVFNQKCSVYYYCDVVYNDLEVDDRDLIL